MLRQKQPAQAQLQLLGFDLRRYQLFWQQLWGRIRNLNTFLQLSKTQFYGLAHPLCVGHLD